LEAHGAFSSKGWSTGSAEGDDAAGARCRSSELEVEGAARVDTASTTSLINAVDGIATPPLVAVTRKV
jgi:hypothetical protein